ncbi:MAG: signal peptidase II, partial [Acidimicrobiia bacterium]|nr:signal peptidase II [Acidimicrobiia bacterium]MYH06307.1 signal peptidase II [Acidimicrobiia bacterium]
VVGWALRTPRPGLEVIGLGLVMGGAVGNLVDRATRGEGLLDGKVVDWIQVPNFPVFNLADTALTVGVGLVLLSALRQSIGASGS